ncbi:MAG: copper transport protein, partial [Solirubrobacteraceae bacterium]|nr:copper transport protein [Solirubrobacteraceae bacterium]
MLGASCAGPAAAVAHPLLVQAAPTPGLVAPSAPAAVQLQFSEPTVPRGSSLVLLGPGGRRVPVGSVSAGDGGRTLTLTPDRKLAPAVYRVRWSALGADGHGVGGTFAFAVAGPHGPPPGAAGIAGQAGTGGTGAQSAQLDGVLAVAVRWLGLLAASLLAGGFALITILRRRLGADEGELAARRWQRAARLSIPALVIAAAGGIVAAVTQGAGGADLGLLTGTPTGRAELVRAIVVM